MKNPAKEAVCVQPALIKMGELRKEFVPAAESTIRTWISNGEFPKPIRLGPRSTAFIRDEIEAWQRTKIEERNQAHYA